MRFPTWWGSSEGERPKRLRDPRDYPAWMAGNATRDERTIAMVTTIEVLYFEGCPNHGPAVELAKAVVAEVAPEARVEEVEVRDNDDAARVTS